MAKDDEALKGLLIHRNPRVRELVKARAKLRSMPLHQKRLRNMMAQAKAAGGRLPNPLNYYGASTGRWSGGEHINTANLPTRGSGIETQIKHCLTAPEGCVLVMADAAQIEARGLAWLAGQDDLIAAFERDEDIYSTFVQENLALACRKPNKSDPKPVYALYAARRATGKVPVLGAGYGMGGDRCLEYMLTYPELAPRVESGEIDLNFCKRLIDAYRRRYPMIPKIWNDLEATFKYVTRYGQTQELRGLRLSRDGGTTVLTLPSGRSLFYPHATVCGSGREERIRWHWGDLWGGTLTENVVQAMSRDVLAEAILFIEDHGFHVGHHVYDSVVVVVKESEDTLAFACVSEALKRTPAWALGWPLNCEVTINRRYE